jgi:hypothetical protein
MFAIPRGNFYKAKAQLCYFFSVPAIKLTIAIRASAVFSAPHAVFCCWNFEIVVGL